MSSYLTIAECSPSARRLLPINASVATAGNVLIWGDQQSNCDDAQSPPSSIPSVFPPRLEGRKLRPGNDAVKERRYEHLSREAHMDSRMPQPRPI